MKQKKRTKTELKNQAQDEVLHAISVLHSYWNETHDDNELRKEVKKLGDRLAKQYGYTELWGS